MINIKNYEYRTGHIPSVIVRNARRDERKNPCSYNAYVTRYAYVTIFNTFIFAYKIIVIQSIL